MIGSNADKILNFVYDNVFKIVIALLVLFVIVIPKYSSNKSKNKTKPQINNSSKITFNIIVKGNGTITVQGNEYVVEEVKDFEIEIPKHTDVTISWKSNIEDTPMNIHIEGDGCDQFKKDWKSTQGELSFRTGDTSCFITTIRHGWI